MFVRIAALFLAIVALSACQFGGTPPSPTQDVVRTISGLSEPDLIACAGHPDRVQTSALDRILIYEGADVRHYPEETRLGLGRYSAGSDLARDSYRSGYCQAEVRIEAGQVRGVAFRGTPSWRGTNPCSERLASCR